MQFVDLPNVSLYPKEVGMRLGELDLYIRLLEQALIDVHPESYKKVKGRTLEQLNSEVAQSLGLGPSHNLSRVQYCSMLGDSITGILKVCIAIGLPFGVVLQTVCKLSDNPSPEQLAKMEAHLGSIAFNSLENASQVRKADLNELVPTTDQPN